MRTDISDDIDRLFDRMHRFTGMDDGLTWGGEGQLRVDLSEHDDHS